eukprot:Hpha_TRINITY_DN15804_c1_g6::TRINITY_DN15804_c1_g6_i1::g.190024::m.190024
MADEEEKGAGEDVPEPEPEPPVPIDPFEISGRFRYFTVHLDTDTPTNVRPADLMEGKGSFREQFGDAVRVLERDATRDWFVNELVKELAELTPPVEPPPEVKRMETAGADPGPELLACAYHCRVASLAREQLREEAGRIEARQREAERRAKQRGEYLEMGLPTDEIDAQDAEAAREDAAVPASVEVFCPNVAPELSGVYRLLPDQVRGQSCWIREGGGGWLSDNGRGYWVISAAEGHFEAGFGYIRSGVAHDGSLPHHVSNWVQTQPGQGWKAAEVRIAAEEAKTFIFFADYPRNLAELEALQSASWVQRPFAGKRLCCHCCATVNASYPLRPAESADVDAKGKKPAAKGAKPAAKKGKGADAEDLLPKESLHKLLRQETTSLSQRRLRSDLLDVLLYQHTAAKTWFGSQLVGQREGTALEEMVNKLGPRFDELEADRRRYELWGTGKLGRELHIPDLVGYEAPKEEPKPKPKTSDVDPAITGKKPAPKKGKVEEAVEPEPEQPLPPQPPELPESTGTMQCLRSYYDELMTALPDDQVSVGSLLQCMVEQVALNDECRRRAKHGDSGGDAFGDDESVPEAPPKEQAVIEAAVEEEQNQRQDRQRNDALSHFVDTLFGKLEGEENEVRRTKLHNRRADWAVVPAPERRPPDVPGCLAKDFPLGCVVKVKALPRTACLRRETEEADWGVRVNEEGVVEEGKGELPQGARLITSLKDATGLEAFVDYRLQTADWEGVVVGHSRGRVGVGRPDGSVEGVPAGALQRMQDAPGGDLRYGDLIGAREGAARTAEIRGVPLSAVDHALLDKLAAPGQLVPTPGLMPPFGRPKEAWVPPAETVERGDRGKAVAWRRADEMLCFRFQDGSELEVGPEDEARYEQLLAHSKGLEPGGESKEVEPLPPPPGEDGLPPLPAELASVDVRDVLSGRQLAREHAQIRAAELVGKPVEAESRILEEELDRATLVQRLLSLSSAPVPPVSKSSWLDYSKRHALVVVAQSVPDTRARWLRMQSSYGGRIYFPEWLTWKEKLAKATAGPLQFEYTEIPDVDEEEEEMPQDEEPYEEGEEEPEKEEEPAPEAPEPEEEVEAPLTAAQELEKMAQEREVQYLRQLLRAGPLQNLHVDRLPGSVGEVDWEQAVMFPGDGGQVSGVTWTAGTSCVHSVLYRDGVTAGVHCALDGNHTAPQKDGVQAVSNPLFASVTFEDGTTACIFTRVETPADASPQLATLLQLGATDGNTVSIHSASGEVEIIRAKPPVVRTEKPPAPAPGAPPVSEQHVSLDGKVRVRNTLGGSQGVATPETLRVYDPHLSAEAEIASRERARRVLPTGAVVRRFECGAVQVLLPEGSTAVHSDGAWLVTTRTERTAVVPGHSPISLPPLSTARQREPDFRSVVEWRSDMVVRVEYDEKSVSACGSVLVQHADGTRIWTQRTADGGVVRCVECEGLPSVDCRADVVVVRQADGGRMVWTPGGFTVQRTDGGRAVVDTTTGILQAIAGCRGGYFIDCLRGGVCADVGDGEVYAVSGDGTARIVPRSTGESPAVQPAAAPAPTGTGEEGKQPEVEVKADAEAQAEATAGDIAGNDGRQGTVIASDGRQGTVIASEGRQGTAITGSDSRPGTAAPPPCPAVAVFAAALAQCESMPDTFQPADLPSRFSPPVFPNSIVDSPAQQGADEEAAQTALKLLHGEDTESNPPAVFFFDLKRAAEGAGNPVASQLLHPAELGAYLRRFALETGATLEHQMESLTFRTPRQHPSTVRLVHRAADVPRAVETQRCHRRRPLSESALRVPSGMRVDELSHDLHSSAANGDSTKHGAGWVSRSILRHSPIPAEHRLLLRHCIRERKLVEEPAALLTLPSAETLAAALAASGATLAEGRLHIVSVSDGSPAAAAGVSEGWAILTMAGASVSDLAEAESVYAVTAAAGCQIALSPPATAAPSVSATETEKAAAGGTGDPDGPAPAEASGAATTGTKQKVPRGKPNPVTTVLKEADAVRTGTPSFWKSREGLSVLDTVAADRMRYARARKQEQPVEAEPGEVPAEEPTAEEPVDAPPQEEQQGDAETAEAQEAMAEAHRQRLVELAEVVRVFPKHAFTETRMILRRPESPGGVTALVFQGLMLLLKEADPASWTAAQHKLTDPRVIPRLQRLGANHKHLGAAVAASLAPVVTAPEFTAAQGRSVLLDLAQVVQWVAHVAAYGELNEALYGPPEPILAQTSTSAGTEGMRGHELDVYGRARTVQPKPAALRSDAAHSDPNLRHLEREAGSSRTVRFCGNRGQQDMQKKLKEGSVKGQLDPILLAQGRMVVSPPQCAFGTLTEGKRYALDLTLTNVGQLAGRFAVRRLKSETHERINDVVSFFYKKGPLAPGMSVRVQVVIAVDTLMPPLDETIEIATETQIVQVPLTANIVQPATSPTTSPSLRRSVRCLGPTRLPALG